MASDDDDKKPKFKYLLPSEASMILRVSPKTLANWRWRGTGPKYRKHGGTVVYSIEDIERYSGDDDKSHVG